VNDEFIIKFDVENDGERTAKVGQHFGEVAEWHIFD